jgi:hypothetical protein
MSQDDKMFLNLAGEFAVASELNRRRVLASVTYGASKSADIFATNRDMTQIVRIEVKTTEKGKWPIGGKATKLTPQSADVLWVLVLLPSPLSGSILTTLNVEHTHRAFSFFPLKNFSQLTGREPTGSLPAIRLATESLLMRVKVFPMFAYNRLKTLKDSGRKSSRVWRSRALNWKIDGKK